MNDFVDYALVIGSLLFVIIVVAQVVRIDRHHTAKRRKFMASNPNIPVPSPWPLYFRIVGVPAMTIFGGGMLVATYEIVRDGERMDWMLEGAVVSLIFFALAWHLALGRDRSMNSIGPILRLYRMFRSRGGGRSNSSGRG